MLGDAVMTNRFLVQRQADTPRIAVSSTACFPEAEQDFAYRQYEFLQQALGGDLHIMHSDVKDPRVMPPELRDLLDAGLYVHPAGEIHEADYQHYKNTWPDRVDSLVEAITGESGLDRAQLEQQFAFMLAFSYARVSQAMAFDYLHSWFTYDQSLCALVTSWLLGIPRGICLFGGPRGDYELELLRLHLRTAELVVADTDETRDALLAVGPPELSDKLMVTDPDGSLSGGVDKIREIARSAVPRAKLGVDEAYRTTSRSLDAIEPVQRFVVIGAERTGSNLLMELLDSHPQIVGGGEIVNPWFIDNEMIPWSDGEFLKTPELVQLRAKDPLAFIDAMFEKGLATGAERVGFKLLYYHGSMNGVVLDYLSNSLAGLKVIHLRRRNRLRRYFSEVRASDSGKWYLSQQSFDPGMRAGIRLDPLEVIRNIESVAFEEEKYDALFRNHKTLNLYFEDMAADLRATSEVVAEFLEVSPGQLEARSKKAKTPGLRDAIANYDELENCLASTRWTHYFDG